MAVTTHYTRVKLRPEKIVRDCIRLEIAAALALASDGRPSFLDDVLARCHPDQRRVALEELRSIEAMLRIKVEAQDEA